MTQINILLAEEEDKKVNELSEKWKLSKVETVKKVIRDFNENPNLLSHGEEEPSPSQSARSRKKEVAE